MKKLIITLLVLLLPTMSFADNQWAWEADGYTTDGSITTGDTVFETDSTNPSALKNLSKQIPIVVQIQSGGGVLSLVDIATTPCDASNDLVMGYDRTTKKTYICDSDETAWYEPVPADAYYDSSTGIMAVRDDYRVPKYNSSCSLNLHGSATYCANLDAQGYTDWYLPSVDELQAMWIHKDKFNMANNIRYWSTNSYCYVLNGSSSSGSTTCATSTPPPTYIAMCIRRP